MEWRGTTAGNSRRVSMRRCTKRRREGQEVGNREQGTGKTVSLSCPHSDVPEAGHRAPGSFFDVNIARMTMEKPTRREVLKGMAAASLIPATLNAEAS